MTVRIEVAGETIMCSTAQTEVNKFW